MRRYLLVNNCADGNGDMEFTLAINYETLSWIQTNLLPVKHYRYSNGPEKHIIVTNDAMIAIALACSIN